MIIVENNKSKVQNKVEAKKIEKVIFYLFIVSVFLLTVAIYILSPKQEFFHKLANNDVWFGDGWVYTDTGERIKSGNEQYIVLDAINDEVTFSKIVERDASDEDYLCMRVKAQNMEIKLNDTLFYEHSIKEEYREQAADMYMMRHVAAKGIKKGDKLIITLKNDNTEEFIVQYLAMGDRYAITNYICKCSAVSIIMCVIAFMLIVLNLIVSYFPSILARIQGRDTLKWLTLFLCASIVYISFNSGLLDSLFERTSFNNWMSDISLLMLPMPFIMYTHYAFFPGHVRYQVLATFNFIVTVCSIIGFVFGSYSLTKSFTYIHLIIAVGVVMCVFSFVEERLMPSLEVIIGYVALCGAAIVGVIIYRSNWMYQSATIFGYGLDIFCMCMLIWTIRSSYEMNKTREEMDKEIMKREKIAAEKANEHKTKFLSQMSHEIRTPLNAMLGMNELISKETDNETIRKYSANIHSAGRTLLALINDVLDFSKIESGKLDIVLSDYSLSSVLNDVVLMTQERALDKKLEIKLYIGDDVPDLLYGDEVRIKQIILNLMTNAVKYTEKGWIKLDLRAIYDKDEIEKSDVINLKISVIDSGIGIKKEELSVLFKEFERLDVHKNNTVEGTGLGLPITARLVSLMDGSIDVHSEYGIGSSFVVTIPQKVINPDPIGDYQKRFEKFRNPGAVHKETEEVKFTGKKVLTVDDNEMNLEVISSILELMDIEVSKSNGGREAKERLRREKFDLVLTDDMMPDINGTQLMEWIKKSSNEINYTTPVVVLTANAVVGAREDYFKKGFDDYMTKPIDIDILQKILMKYLK